MIVTVNSTSALESALSAAKGGDTIQLATGVYNPIQLWGRNFAQDVVVTSVDPSAPAVLKGLTLGYSSGLTFTGLELDTTAGASQFIVQFSRDVHFSDVKVHGSLDGNPQNDNLGLYFHQSTDVSVSDSEFFQLRQGVVHSGDTGLRVTNNSFHDIRIDGVAGGGSSDVLISGNTFRDFYPVNPDHPDAIQFWTTNTTASARDIVISDNRIEVGSGSKIQGIFFRDEVGNIPYERVTITGNVVVGEHYNGIAVLGGRQISITDNIVQGFTDMKSWIVVNNVTGGAISGNAANEYVDWGGVSGVGMSGNAVLGLAADRGAAAIATWSVVTAADNQSLQGGAGNNAIAGGPGGDTITDLGGANYLRGDAGADSLTAGAGNDDLGGGAGNDTLAGGAGDDWLSGGDGLDQLRGDDGADFLFGGLGADSFDGGGGADVLRGGQGDDYILGGLGNDWLSGDRGGDKLYGGPGADIFHSFGAAGIDRVMDFRAAEGDRVQLATGSSYSVAQVGADTVVSVGGGAQVILAQTQLASLPAGWLFVG